MHVPRKILIWLKDYFVGTLADFGKHEEAENLNFLIKQWKRRGGCVCGCGRLKCVKLRGEGRIPGNEAVV